MSKWLHINFFAWAQNPGILSLQPHCPHNQFSSYPAGFTSKICIKSIHFCDPCHQSWLADSKGLLALCPAPVLTASSLPSTAHQITFLPSVTFQCPSEKILLPIKAQYDLASNLSLYHLHSQDDAKFFFLFLAQAFVPAPPSQLLNGWHLPCEVHFLREALPASLIKVAIHTCFFLP